MQDIVTRKQAIERGLLRYFTGEACKRGHVGERYTLNAACVECNAEAQQRHRDQLRGLRERLERVEKILDERGEA